MLTVWSPALWNFTFSKVWLPASSAVKVYSVGKWVRPWTRAKLTVPR